MGIEEKFERRGGMESSQPFRTLIHFTRHGEKAGGNKVKLDVDLAMPLTPKGREQARGLSELLETKRPIAGSGMRKRLRETTSQALAYHYDPEAGDIEHAEEYLENSEHGTRVWKNPALDLSWPKYEGDELSVPQATLERLGSENGLYFKAIMDMDAELRQSDNRNNESVYTKHAYNIARIVKREIEWSAKLQAREAYDTNSESDAAQRGIKTRELLEGTQGGIGESFLAEVILRVAGQEQQDAFVDSLKNGFDFREGFDVEIMSTGSQPTVRVILDVKKERHFSFDQEIPIDVIDDIIRDFAPKEGGKTTVTDIGMI